jgi:hypothetical protein
LPEAETVKLDAEPRIRRVDLAGNELKGTVDQPGKRSKPPI